MAASPTTEPAAQSSSLRTGAWVLYDLANTVYIATVTFVFTPYASEVLDGDLRGHGVANFLSMIAAAVLVPFFGALIDTTGRTRRYLTLATAACIAALAFSCASSITSPRRISMYSIHPSKHTDTAGVRHRAIARSTVLRCFRIS